MSDEALLLLIDNLGLRRTKVPWSSSLGRVQWRCGYFTAVLMYVLSQHHMPRKASKASFKVPVSSFSASFASSLEDQIPNDQCKVPFPCRVPCSAVCFFSSFLSFLRISSQNEAHKSQSIRRLFYLFIYLDSGDIRTHESAHFTGSKRLCNGPDACCWHNFKLGRLFVFCKAQLCRVQ